MTRRTFEFGEEEEQALLPGSYTVEITPAQPWWRGEDPDATACVFLTLRVLTGPYAGRTTEVKVNCPTDEQMQHYKDGGKFHRKSVRGMRVAFTKAAVEAPEDDERYFQILEEELLGLVLEADLKVKGSGKYEGTQELGETNVVEKAPTPTPALDSGQLQGPFEGLTISTTTTTETAKRNDEPTTNF